MPFMNAGEGELHYQTYGIGNKIIVAFHGYGEQASTFAVFAPHLGRQYTILAFDLPFHGQSVWRNTELTHDCLLTLIKGVTETYHVPTITLMGYSIGARVSLAAMCAAPLHIEGMLLMAADGLTINRFYQFATNTWLGRWLFRKLLEGHSIVPLANMTHRLKLLPNALYRLAMHSVGKADSRQQLLHAWPCLRSLVHTPGQLRRQIEQAGVTVHLYMGAKDKILPPRLGIAFAKDIDSIHLHILERGHRIFDADNAGIIAAPLLQV